MPHCLVCRASIEPFLDFGPMPIANGFLPADQFARERSFSLRVGFCAECKTVQLTDRVDPHLLFHENYAFFSSTSRRMAEHFERLANHLLADLLDRDPFVVEIGSNDGITLRHFARKGVRHLGIEPSENVAAAARAQGIRTESRFFDAEAARSIRERDGPADLILGTNVLCHIPDLPGVFEGVSTLLSPKGILVFEDPYLGDIIAKTSYDQIYDEHVFYFSVTSVARLAARHGLEVFDIAPQSVHGGSMRYYVARRGARPVTARVAKQMEHEAQLGLSEPRTFDRFRAAVEASRDALLAELRSLRAQGLRVAGYGATSKSTTVTNYCGITPDLVEYISDTTKSKQGLYSPGAHIPVRSHEHFRTDPPDVALLFAWNHESEILEKERAWLESGGRFLTYVPAIRTITGRSEAAVRSTP